MNELLIFDLDDTLFETKSIGKKVIQPIFDQFEILLNTQFSNELTEQIIIELWTFPFDAISRKHRFANQLNNEFARLINQASYELDIKLFEDYKLVENLKNDKVLVTTGFVKLQNAKIHHLDLRKKFSEIHIDDILDPKRVFKKGIFQNILLEKGVDPQYAYVIGDNPDSELKAGFELGINTVQVAKFGQKQSDYADYYIADYKELITILS